MKYKCAYVFPRCLGRNFIRTAFYSVLWYFKENCMDMSAALWDNVSHIVIIIIIFPSIQFGNERA